MPHPSNHRPKHPERRATPTPAPTSADRNALGRRALPRNARQESAASIAREQHVAVRGGAKACATASRRQPAKAVPKQMSAGGPQQPEGKSLSESVRPLAVAIGQRRDRGSDAPAVSPSSGGASAGTIFGSARLGALRRSIEEGFPHPAATSATAASPAGMQTEAGDEWRTTGQDPRERQRATPEGPHRNGGLAGRPGKRSHRGRVRVAGRSRLSRRHGYLPG